MTSTSGGVELFDKEFLVHQRDLLREEHRLRVQIVGGLEVEIADHMRRRETGAGPTEGFGSGETESVELEGARDQHARALERLADIDAALARLDDGTYGWCQRCGGSIGRDRLEAMPTATRCITCEGRT